MKSQNHHKKSAV